MDDFRKSELKDLDHVVVNGYFPSLTIKHVSPYYIVIVDKSFGYYIFIHRKVNIK